MWLRRVLNTLILRPFVWTLLRSEISGVENIPAQGSFILMVNHCNFLDPFFTLYTMLPREVVVFTKVENLHKPGLSLLMRSYGSIPVERGEADINAIKKAMQVFDRGKEVLLVAPEGTRSYDGRLLAAKNGMAFLATRANVPILPVGVTGVKDFWENFKHLRRTRVRARIGHPFRFRHDGRVRKEMLSVMTREAMYQLAALLPVEQWGAYSDMENASEEYLEFLQPGSSNLTYAGTDVLADEQTCSRQLAGAVE